MSAGFVPHPETTDDVSLLEGNIYDRCYSGKIISFCWKATFTIGVIQKRLLVFVGRQHLR